VPPSIMAASLSGRKNFGKPARPTPHRDRLEISLFPSFA
jgi:hypothetical protein